MYCSNNNSPLTQSDVICSFRGYVVRHVLWMRVYIADIISETQNADYTGEQAAENARDFTEMIRKYYGYEHAREVESLLLDGIAATRDTLRNIKAGDVVMKDEHRGFNVKLTNKFAAMNPNWKRDELYRYLDVYYKTLEDEMRHHMENHGGDGDTRYREAGHEALEMADFMAEGFIRQFGIIY